MRIYLDLDCLTKLVAFGLFDDAMQLFEANAEDIYVIDTFRFKCESLQKRAVKKNEQEKANAYASAIELLKSFSTVEMTEEEITLAANLKRTGIDDGEAALLTRLATDGTPARFLATGDIRFMTALGNAMDLPGIFRNCKGRIISLNRLLVHFTRQMDFPSLLSRMTTPLSQSMDTVVRMAFTPDTTPDRTLEYLENFAPPVNSYCFTGKLPDE